MAIVTNTYLTFDATAIREELSNVIYNISPTETPFISNIGKGGKVSNTYFEWQNDALAAAAANEHLEGNEQSYTAVVPSTRLANFTQISKKDVIVSGTQEAVNHAGVKSMLAYQMAKRSAELKRDMEYVACRNQAARAGDSTTTRRTAGFESFIRTNTDFATGGSPSGANPVLSGTTSGYPDTAPVDDGTPRAFTETILKNVLQKIWTAGGTPKMCIVDATNKVVFSGFSGIASQRFNAKDGVQSTIIGAADVYVSDFGNLSVVPSRFSRTSSALFVDPEYAELVFLRPFKVEDMAKTGDAMKKVITVEWGLKLSHESAHGIARDLT